MDKIKINFKEVEKKLKKLRKEKIKFDKAQIKSTKEGTTILPAWFYPLWGFITMLKFKEYTKSQIDFALKDIKEVLTIWRDNKNLDDRYIVKLYKEFDFLITLKQKGVKWLKWFC